MNIKSQMEIIEKSILMERYDNLQKNEFICGREFFINSFIKKCPKAKLHTIVMINKHFNHNFDVNTNKNMNENVNENTNNKD